MHRVAVSLQRYDERMELKSVEHFVCSAKLGYWAREDLQERFRAVVRIDG
jgi:hypothetical protein